MTNDHSLTPGPWKAKGCDVWQAGEDRLVAECVNAANARLIAAAPDLLAAIKRLNRVADCQESGYQDARAQADRAIAKAEGRE